MFQHYHYQVQFGRMKLLDNLNGGIKCMANQLPLYTYLSSVYSYKYACMHSSYSYLVITYPAICMCMIVLLNI